MSGLNGSGEMSLGNLKVEIAESNTASLFARDIVNEVLQKALDIATQVHESKLMWSPVGGNNCCHSLISDCVKKDFDIRFEGGNRHTLEMETEKLESDVPSPPCKELPGRGGVGDQPNTPRGNEVEVSDEPAPQEYTTVPVEKKSRVADLVKSSKQVLTAYIMDEKAKRIRDKLEEEQEQFLQVIELDCVDGTFTAFKKHDPTEIPLPSDDVDTEGEFMEIPRNDAMDTIDLNKVEEETTAAEESECGKGDESPKVVPPEEIQRAEVENVASPEAPSESDSKTSEGKDKKKKWNLGARLMQFLRRPRQKARGTQTVSRK